MPEVYRVDDSREPTTRIQVLAGPEMLFGQLSPPRLASVHDGTSNTILAVVADADQAVPWTQPDDLTFDPAAPLAVLGGMTDPWIPCAVVDGSTLMLPNTVDANTFLALATPAEARRSISIITRICTTRRRRPAPPRRPFVRPSGRPRRLRRPKFLTKRPWCIPSSGPSPPR
jgi:hypothetical protein